MKATDNKLKRYVDANGVDLANMAKAAGVKRDTLRKIVAGHIRPGVDTAKRIIRATCGAIGYEDIFGDPFAEPLPA